jgi:hypothetical protein
MSGPYSLAYSGLGSENCPPGFLLSQKWHRFALFVAIPLA